MTDAKECEERQRPDAHERRVETPVSVEFVLRTELRECEDSAFEPIRGSECIGDEIAAEATQKHRRKQERECENRNGDRTENRHHPRRPSAVRSSTNVARRSGFGDQPMSS